MRLLLVEDHLDFANLVRDALSPFCFVFNCQTVEKALFLLSTHSFDFAILDIKLSDGTGFEVADFIRSKPALDQCNIIFLTGQNSADACSRALETRADDFITKPVRLEELVLKIRNKIEYRELLLNSARTSKINTAEPTDTATQNDPSAASSQFREPFTRLIEGKGYEAHRIAQVLLMNIGDPNFSLNDAAAILGRSSRSLNRDFQRVFGLSFSKVLTKCRMEKAYGLLASGCRVATAANETGFRSASYFATVFKTEFNTTPREFSAGFETSALN